jgi:hypothetical protein
MIALLAVSPENELRVAQRLCDSIERAWPDAAASRRDRIDVLVGIRTPAEVDILVLLELERPREVPPPLRRGGGRSAPFAVQHALIALEVKQLDAARFERIGNQMFPIYGGRREDRSVAKQACDAALAVAAFARQSGAKPFVHGLASS